MGPGGGAVLEFTETSVLLGLAPIYEKAYYVPGPIPEVFNIEISRKVYGVRRILDLSLPFLFSLFLSSSWLPRIY